MAASPERVLTRYDLGPISSLAPLDSGYQSDNWLVTTPSGRYVLKRLSVGGADPDAMMQLLAWLDEAGVPVPAPVSATSGEWHVVCAGVPWIVNRFLAGTPLRPSRVDASLARIGRELGSLHRACARLEREHGDELRALGPTPEDVLLGWFERWAREPGPARAFTRLRDELVRLPPLTRGPLNGDLGPHSLLFQGERLSGILDFGAACTWYLLFDVASTLMYVGGYRPERAAQCRELLAGYAETAPIGARELDHLPLFARCRALVQIGYFDMRLRQGITQGNDDAENRAGYADGLELLALAESLPASHYTV